MNGVFYSWSSEVSSLVFFLSIRSIRISLSICRSRVVGRKVANIPEAAKIIRKTRINILITFFSVFIEIKMHAQKEHLLKIRKEPARWLRDKNYPRFSKRVSALERGRKLAIRFMPMGTMRKIKSALFLKQASIEFE
jgi:hypothetical protein